MKFTFVHLKVDNPNIFVNVVHLKIVTSVK